MSGQADERGSIPKTQWVVAVLWPGFLVSAAATIVLFTLIDPLEFGAFMGWPEISRVGAYTSGFFLLWGLTVVSSLLTCYFQKPCESRHQQQPQ